MEPPLVKDIIDSNYLAVEPDCLLSDVIAQMYKHRSSYALVVKDKEPIGIITESDTVGLLMESFQGVSWDNLPVDHVMTSPVIAVTEDVNVLEAVAIAQNGRIRHIPIVDGTGQIAGVLNQMEIVQAIALYCRQGDLW